MAAAGLYTFGGSFWEFGEPDWKHTKYFLLFGVAEDHASNPIKTGLGKLKAQGRQIRFHQSGAAPAIRQSPMNGSASGPAPMACLSAPSSMNCWRAQKIDGEYLQRYTNAPWLVIENPGGADDGLFAAQCAAARPWSGMRHTNSPMPATLARCLAKAHGALHPARWPQGGDQLPR